MPSTAVPRARWTTWVAVVARASVPFTAGLHGPPPGRNPGPGSGGFPPQSPGIGRMKVEMANERQYADDSNGGEHQQANRNIRTVPEEKERQEDPDGTREHARVAENGRQLDLQWMMIRVQQQTGAASTRSNGCSQEPGAEPKPKRTER